MMRAAIRHAVFTLASLVAARAHAQKSESVGSLELHVVHTDLPLRGASFDGDGRDAHDEPKSYSAKGVQIGLVDPRVTLFEGALATHLGRRDDAQFSFALILGGGSTKADATPTGGAPFPTSDTFTIFRGGAEMGGGGYLGPLYLQGSVFVGGASVWTSIIGLVPCRSRLHGGTGCGAIALADIFYFEPRFSLQLELPICVTVGGYVGDNLAHPESPEMGLTVGVRTWSGTETCGPKSRWSFM